MFKHDEAFHESELPKTQEQIPPNKSYNEIYLKLYFLRWPSCGGTIYSPTVPPIELISTLCHSR
jgi:hypothetical protein